MWMRHNLWSPMLQGWPVPVHTRKTRTEKKTGSFKEVMVRESRRSWSGEGVGMIKIYCTDRYIGFTKSE